MRRFQGKGRKMSGEKFHLLYFESMTEVPVYDEGTTTVICTTGSPVEKEDPNQVTLEIEVRFDSTQTDAESIASALDQLLETAMSTPGILEDHGNIIVDEFSVKRKF
jgi:hypothetical protein